MHNRFSIICLFLIVNIAGLSAEENFLLVHGTTNETIYAMGNSLDHRLSPYSTFKIALCLIGYDAGILKDLETPTWQFQQGYEEDLPAWKTSQNPHSWMKSSCVWYSKILAGQIGEKALQNYLALFEYGNGDLSGGISNPGSPAWIDSSLKISVREQVGFLQKLVQEQLPISLYAIEMTKGLIFREELNDGWRLYGKQGGGNSTDTLEYGWFVGWVQKQNLSFPFAYLICDKKIEYAQIFPRVKQLIREAKTRGKNGNIDRTFQN